MSALTDQLVANATCLEMCIPVGMRWPIVISLLAQIAGVPLNTNQLAANAECVANCIPTGMQTAVIIYLLNQMAGGSGLAGGGVFAGAYGAGNPPNFTPVTAAAAGINTDDGRVWWYYSLAWH